MKTPVSIVMAAKNYARFLPSAVDSVLAQSFPNWELIIVDDGSTDHTPEVVKPYLADSRIRYYRTDRLGQSRTKNLGIRLSQGEIIAFLDADDLWRPQKLERQLNLFAHSPRTGVVFTRRELIDEQGTILPRPASPPPPRGRVLDPIFVQNFICFSSVTLRRHLFDQVGFFNPNQDLAIDYDLWLRMAPHTEFDYVDEPLVLYRTGHGNLSQKQADRVATAFTIMNRAIRRQSEICPSSQAKGFASTSQTMGWVYRKGLPGEAWRWYLNAMRWPHDRWLSMRGLVATGLNALKKPRDPISAENRPENF